MSKELERVREEIARPIRQEIMMRSYALTETGELFDMKVAAIKANEIADQILKIKGLVIESDNQELPEVEEDNPFIRLDEQQKMLNSNFRRVTK